MSKADNLPGVPNSADAARIALFYGAIGAVWIFSSRWLVSHCVHDESLKLTLEAGNGWFCVFATAVVLGLGLNRYFQQIRRSVQLLKAQRDGFATDITEHQKLQEEQRQKTALLQALVNSSPDGIMVLDQQRRRVIQNPKFDELLGIPAQIAEQPDLEPQFEYVTGLTVNQESFRENRRFLAEHRSTFAGTKSSSKMGAFSSDIPARLSASAGKTTDASASCATLPSAKTRSARLNGSTGSLPL